MHGIPGRAPSATVESEPLTQTGEAPVHLIPTSLKTLSFEPPGV